MQFLSSPAAFHARLLQAISSSKKEIYLSTLYLGDSSISDTENSLRQELQAATERGVSVKVLSDYARSSRPGINYSWLKMMESRYSFTHFGTNYFACNRSLIPITPSPFNEIFGLFHFKLNVFDSKHILITGANLSENYFTNRQDRYLWLENERKLATYCQTILDRLHALSFQSTNRIPPPVSPFKHPKRFCGLANEVFKDLSTPEVFKSESQKSLWFLPVIQLNGLGIRGEQQLISHLFRSDFTAIRHITSPYFNFPSHYIDSIAKANNPVNVLTAAPESNGFYNAPGIKRYIPDAYEHLEQNFMKVTHLNPRLRLYNYRRPGWSYHGKGIWITPLAKDESIILPQLPGNLDLNDDEKELNDDKSKLQLPCLTTIGSSNYGHRSTSRDLEFQLILYSKSESVRQMFHSDLQNIWRYATERGDHDSRAKRPTWWLPLAMPFVKTMF